MRFSLKRLIALVTVVAVIFGVQQIHRQKILRQVENFKAEGVTIEIGNTWRDFFWLQVPANALIKIELRPPNVWHEWKVGSKRFAQKDGERYVSVLARELLDFGVKTITVTHNQSRPAYLFLDDDGNAYLRRNPSPRR